MTKLKEIQIAPIAKGESITINLLDTDGGPSDCAVELRYEENGRFRLFFHSEETCAEGCEPVVDLTFCWKGDEPAEPSVNDFLDALSAIFGDSAMVIDEHGLRPASRKKQN